MKNFFNQHPRLGGAIFLLIFGLVGGLYIWPSLDQARHEAAQVTMPGMHIVSITGFMLSFGLMLVLFGPAMVQAEQKRLTALGWIATVVAFACGLGLYFWLQAQFAALGYH